FIFLRTSRKILKFSRDGKYLSPIGLQGRGPSEYNGLRNISIDNENERVFVYPNWVRELLIYTFDNKYLGKIPLFDSYFDLALSVSSIDNNHFIATGVGLWPGEFSKEMFLVALLDSTGIIIEKVDSPLMQSANFINNNSIYYPGTGAPSYYDSLALSIGWGCDTMYSVSQNGIEPRYILNFGKYDAPFEIKYGNSFDKEYQRRIMGKRYGYIWIQRAPIETRDYLFLQFSFNDYLYLSAYSKQTGQSLVFREKGTVKSGLVNYSRRHNIESFGFKNDLDGGLHFYPRWTNLNSNVWITSYNAFELMSSLDEIREIDPENLRKHKKLIELIEKLDENDNPVLVVAHLK
ncbi:MAG: 6-bladed beta-propeller, partial [Cyclobacteriaceae bacterium]